MKEKTSSSTFSVVISVSVALSINLSLSLSLTSLGWGWGGIKTCNMTITTGVAARWTHEPPRGGRGVHMKEDPGCRHHHTA